MMGRHDSTAPVMELRPPYPSKFPRPEGKPKLYTWADDEAINYGMCVADNRKLHYHHTSRKIQDVILEGPLYYLGETLLGRHYNIWNLEIEIVNAYPDFYEKFERHVYDTDRDGKYRSLTKQEMWYIKHRLNEIRK